MNLGQIRESFVNSSGCFYLGDSTTDRGADMFINAGIKFLDSLISLASERFQLDLNKGDSLFELPNLKSIIDVYIVPSSAPTTKLRAVMTDLRRILNVQNWNPFKSGQYYYALNPIFPAPSQAANRDGTPGISIDSSRALDDIHQIGDTGNYNSMGIKLYPDLTEDSTVVVVGDFYSQGLVNNSDHNKWTDLQPYLVIDAARMELERSRSNMSLFQALSRNLMERVYLIETHKGDLEAQLATEEYRGNKF